MRTKFLISMLGILSFFGVAHATTPFGDVMVVSPRGIATYYNATTSSDVGRGTALMTALSNAQSGSSLYLASSTFDLISSGVDLTKSGTGSLSLHGAGKYSTILKSSRTGTANPIIKPASNSITSDLTIFCVTSAGILQNPYGGSNIGFTNATLRNVYMLCGSDGIYIKASATTTLDVYNLTTLSNFDSVALSQTDESNPVPLTVNMFDSSLTQVASTSFSGSERGVVNGGGIFNSYNTVVSSSGGSVTNEGYETERDTNSTTTVHGGSISTSGTLPYDLDAGGNGVKVIAVTGDTQYDTSKVNHSISYLDSNPIIQSIRRGTDHVGVGTTSPYAKLSVQSTVDNTLFTVASSTTSVSIDNTGRLTVNNPTINDGGGITTRKAYLGGSANSVVGQDALLFLQSSGGGGNSNMIGVEDVGSGDPNITLESRSSPMGTVLADAIFGVRHAGGVGFLQGLTGFSIEANGGNAGTIWAGDQFLGGAGCGYPCGEGITPNDTLEISNGGITTDAGGITVNGGDVCIPSVVCLSDRGSVTVVGTDTTLTGGTITTSGTLGLNLANANTWTGQQIFNTANVGIGTSTPWAKLSIVGNTTPVFAVATSTSGASSKPVFEVDANAHQITSGPKPSVSGGTSSVAGNDNNGTITVVGTLLTSVTLTFANTWGTAPDCTMTDSSTGVTGAITSISATQLVIGFSAGVNSGTVWFSCRGHN